MRRPASEIAADRKALAESKRGKVLYFGRYRTRDEIVLYLLTHGWEGETMRGGSSRSERRPVFFSLAPIK